MFKRILFFFMFLAFTIPAFAHPLDVIYAEISVDKNILDYNIRIPFFYLADISGLKEYETLNKEQIDINLIQDYFNNKLVIKNENKKCISELTKISLKDDYNTNPVSQATLNFHSECKKNISSLHIESSLLAEYEYPKTFITDITYENKTQNWIFSYVDSATLPIILKENSNSYINRASNFIKLGIKHIFIGYDHIAFILGVIIILLSFKQAIKVITAFTIAHSITLILSTLNIITIPQSYAEVIIALSIAYIGFENLYFKRIKMRWLVAFVFGLFHGFGFSSVLKEIGIQKGFAFISLLSFNVGIEIGQIAIIALIWPLILYMNKHKWSIEFKRTISKIILILGIYWFAIRVFLL